MRHTRTARYIRKISNQEAMVAETMDRYARYTASLLELVPNENTEFRDQFNELVPQSITSNIEGMNERTLSLKEGLVNYLDNPDWIEKSFMEIQEFAPSINRDLEKVERQLSRFRNTDFYPKYIISAVTKLLSSLGWLQQWLSQLFQFLIKLIK